MFLKRESVIKRLSLEAAAEFNFTLVRSGNSLPYLASTTCLFGESLQAVDSLVLHDADLKSHLYENDLKKSHGKTV